VNKLGWTSGAIGTFEPVQGLEEKLRDFSHSRNERDPGSKETFELKSVIHLDTPEANIGSKSRLLSGVVHYEHLYTPQKLEEDRNGRYELVNSDPIVDVKYGRFWLPTKSLVSIVVAEKSSTRDFTFKVLSQAMSKKNNYCQGMKMDVNTIAKDYQRHWISGLGGRRGMLQAGTLYGDTLEREPLLRSEYRGWNKSQVGFSTDFFGPPTKVKVTKDGIVVVYRDLSDRMDLFIRFIQNDLLEYAS